MSRRTLTGRRPLALAATIMIGAAAGLAVSAPAHAALDTVLTPTAVVYTDSAIPGLTHDGASQPAWVGTWTADDRSRTSRAYYTFDLSSLRGEYLTDVTAYADEASVNDCTASRRLQLWQTEPADLRIKWATAPAEVALLGSADDQYNHCPWSGVAINVTGGIRAAVASAAKVTIEVRVPAGDEDNPAYGRSLHGLTLHVRYDHAPDAPSQITISGPVGGKACGPDPLSTTLPNPTVTVTIGDPDNVGGNLDWITAEVEWWPLGNDAAKIDLTGWPASGSPAVPRVQLPGDVADGTYQLRARGIDQDQQIGPWSSVCTVIVDRVGPTTAPTVSSTTYPRAVTIITPRGGGQNVPGDFTFSAGGDPQAIGFRYGLGVPSKFVAADQPGGTATVQITPTSPIQQTLTVVAVDDAGNSGPSATYKFNVANDQPTVKDTTPNRPYLQAHDVTFSDILKDVVRYEYTFNGGPAVSVDADASGVGHAALAPVVAGPNQINVTAITGTGIRTASISASIGSQSAPTVSSDTYPAGQVGGGIGVTGVFTVTSTIGAGGSFTYSVDGQPAGTVPVGDDGSAQLTYTPPTSGGHTLTARQTTAEGYVSSEATYYFTVTSNLPDISADVYQHWLTSGGPGVPGHFTFTRHQAASVSFVYTIDGGPEQSVPVGADGTATITFVPTAGGALNLTVQSVSGDGIRSDTAYWSAAVDPMAPTISRTGDPGQTTIVFTATLPGSAEFVYALDSGEPQTIAVGTDGTASIPWSPPSGVAHSISVFTRAGDLTSGIAETTYYF